MLRTLVGSLVLASSLGVFGGGIAVADSGSSTHATVTSHKNHRAKTHGKKARKKPAKARHHSKTK
jgi:hypothetical protein